MLARYMAIDSSNLVLLPEVRVFGWLPFEGDDAIGQMTASQTVGLMTSDYMTVNLGLNEIALMGICVKIAEEESDSWWTV